MKADEHSRGGFLSVDFISFLRFFFPFYLCLLDFAIRNESMCGMKVDPDVFLFDISHMYGSFLGPVWVSLVKIKGDQNMNPSISF